MPNGTLATGRFRETPSCENPAPDFTGVMVLEIQSRFMAVRLDVFRECTAAEFGSLNACLMDIS